MIRSIVMHQLDYNYIAASEEWYYRCHGPQIARRYGPWLARFESYRPVPVPDDIPGDKLGYTNWLTTVGFWHSLPKEGPMGEMAMSSPQVNAKNFSAFLPAQCEDDFKGRFYSPEEKACLRLVMLWQYPVDADPAESDLHFKNFLAQQIAQTESVYRFFSSPVIQEDLHLPGTWKPEQMNYLMSHNEKSDHQWDRYAELWFETFDDIRSFLAAAKSFHRPSYAQTDDFPFLLPYKNFISTLLLERPAYNWMQCHSVYR